MKTYILPFLFTLITCLPLTTVAQFGEEEEEEYEPAPGKSAPFTAVLWQGDEPMVYFEKEWYFVDSIYKFSAGDLLTYARQRYDGKWKKRFATEYVEICGKLDNPIAEEISLKLYDRTGKVHYAETKMTVEKRDDIKHFRDDGDLMDEILRPEPDKALSKAEMEADLRLLELLVDRYHAYATIRPYDYGAAIDSTIEVLPATLAPEEFAVWVHRFLVPFGDGHAKTNGLPSDISFDRSPIRFKYFGEELLVLDHGSGKLLSPKYPYLSSINGLSRDQLIKRVMTLTPTGSKAFRRAKSERYLMLLDHLLREEGVYSSKLTLKLKNEAGATIVVTKKLTPLGEDDNPLTIPEREEQKIKNPYELEVLSSNIGYVRIRQMEDPSDLDDYTDELMEDVEDTDGLLLDLRDNPGGRRKILHYLGPYFVDPDSAPHIANVSALRTAYPITQGGMDLSRRYLYTKGDDHWSTSDYRAIKAFEKTFQPKWDMPRHHFGPWHYLLLDGDDAEYYYDKPVVVLINEFSFSAVDVFASALKGLDHVTLAGTTSGGGSGRSQSFYLLNSGIKVKLCTMASFQPDGNLFDGVGVVPEVMIEETLDDVLGKTDTQLERALELFEE